MCKMTDFGTRWSRTIQVPAGANPEKFVVSLRDGEDRYAWVHPWTSREEIAWLNPAYAIWVRAKSPDKRLKTNE